MSTNKKPTKPDAKKKAAAAKAKAHLGKPVCTPPGTESSDDFEVPIPKSAEDVADAADAERHEADDDR